MPDLWSARLLVGLICALAATSPAFAAEQGTQDKIPNFSSVDFAWYPQGGVRPPQNGLGPVTYDQAHPVITRSPDQDGNVIERPLPLADLGNPNLKPWIVERLKKANEETLAGREPYGARAACMPAGLPGFLTYGGGFQGLYIIQTPKKITLINHGDSQIRRIYLNVPHSANPKPSWYGESVGHYEGDELVVDTIGLNDKTFLQEAYSLPHTTKLHVIERFKLIQDGNALQASFTIDDPESFNAPWGGIVTYRHQRQPGPLAEEPCEDVNVTHGGSFFPPGTGGGTLYPVPIAAKPDF